jgi:RimJ/RimL family protein N-acetyltransferase
MTCFLSSGIEDASMNLSVSQANESDWQDLRFIRLKALQTDPAVFSSNYQKESAMTEAEWKSWLQTDDAAIFLIRENSILIGMTAISVDRDDVMRKRAILWGSWLEPSARGKGLSRIMYQKRIEWATKHPTIEQIIVSHRASNLPSKYANQKYGFQYTHIEDKIWPDGTREENVFYALNTRRPSAP